MFIEAFMDGERGEVVAVGDYPLIEVGMGEVLFDVRGYVSPSLRRDRQ